MKKIFFLIAVVSSTMGYAQDVALVKMAEEACTCVKGKNLDAQNLSTDQLQMEFGLCILKGYSNHREEFGKTNTTDMGDKGAMRKLGEDVALKMMDLCPEVLMTISNASDAEDTLAPEGEVVEYPSVEGEVTEILIDQFVTIKVKDKYNMVHDLILLDKFETADLYIQNKIKKKDQVTVSYGEVELFDPKAKAFRFYKVITALEKK